MREEPDTMEPNTAIKQLHDLARIATPSTRRMALEERASGIMVMLDDLSKLARINGCVAAAWALELIEVLQKQNQSLRSQVVEWKPGDVLPARDDGEQYIVIIDGKPRLVYDDSDDDGRLLCDLITGLHINWQNISHYVRAKDIPLPQPLAE